MKILVLDNGLYTCQAEALSAGGNEVKFWTPWASPFPNYADYAKGKNFGKLQKEIYLFDHIQWADCIVNFDVSNNDLISYLRKMHPEKSIWGAGLGERLENDRVMFKKWLKAFGLPVGKYEVIVGLSALREYLKKNPHKYIKTNIFRNDMESFFFDTYEEDKYLLDEKALVLGMHQDEYTFVVEDPIKTDVEIGYDGFFTNGEYAPFSFGYEVDKNLYIGKVVSDVDELPFCVSESLEAFQPLLTKMDYRGALSSEERVVTQEEHYFIDFCARLPAPLSQIYPVAIKNWPDLVYKIGKKEYAEIECDYKYVGAYALSTEHAVDHYVKMKVKKGSEKDIRFQMVTENKDGVFAVKGNASVAVLTAGGDTWEEVIDKLKDLSENVDAYGLEKEGVIGIGEQAEKAIEAGKKVGIKF
jgi:hypothetical protein